MNDTAPRAHIDKSTVISIGVAITMASVVFLAGAIYTKVDRLDSLKIESRLSRIEAILERSKAVAIPFHAFQAGCCSMAWESINNAVPQHNAHDAGAERPNINLHFGPPLR